jgi:hypothetical protein
MNRRNFLGFLAGGLAASAAVRTFPFRVFSFPTTVLPGSPEWWADPRNRFKLPSGVELLNTIDFPVGIRVWSAADGDPFVISSKKFSLAEAKARYGYKWRPGYPKTQQVITTTVRQSLYCSPLGISTTGLIP